MNAELTAVTADKLYIVNVSRPEVTVTFKITLSKPAKSIWT
jgi:hypothetical protein